MLKSRKLHQLLSAQEQDEDDEDESEEIRQISLPDFPGVSETFEAAAKFCYGVKIDLSSATAVPLRCAAEYLGMTDDFAEDNLVDRADRFLAQSVFGSLPQSVKALKTCECLLPYAEELGLPQKCIDAIASLACDHHRTAPETEDLTVLNLFFYKRVLSAMMERNPSSEIIEACLVSYARKSFPGLSRSKRNLAAAVAAAAASSLSEQDQMDLLETIITNLPPTRSSVFITTSFLFGLLRTGNILHAPESFRTALEKKIASQLEEATLEDLLMPSYSHLVETLYDVEALERILRHYIEASSRSPARNDDRLLKVGRLVDGYLAEVASDVNLRADKFCNIAGALPEHARLYDDGLYRAIDVYLKAHPAMTEEEMEKVSSVMDCRKLTLEACTHTAQNERLPLRTMLRVLFFEQLQLRQAIAGSILTAGDEERASTGMDGGRWWTATRESQLLRLGMDNMRSRVRDLERECSSMQLEIKKIDRSGTAAAWQRPPQSGGWCLLGRKLGCKSRIQVYDSQARLKRSDD